MRRKVIPRTGKCIYCGEEKEFSQEHYLPECLGKFDYESLNDRICKDCNGHCGRQLEDQLCHAGEVGFIRYALNIQGKKHKTKVNPFKRGSSGAGLMQMKGKIPGQDLEVRLELVHGTKSAYRIGIDYMPQLILTPESGEARHIPIPESMTDQDLKARIDELKLGKLKEVSLIAPESDRERLEKLTKMFSPLSTVAWSSYPMSGATQTMTQYEVTDKYFRAIAKIGFHYLLKHLHFRGDEEIFSGIRNFIMNGDDITKYVTWTKKQILEDVKAGWVPVNYCHILIARATQKEIWAYVQFFLGPDILPYVYKVHIANNPTKLDYSLFAGHQFCLDSNGGRGTTNELGSIFK